MEDLKVITFAKMVIRKHRSKGLSGYEILNVLRYYYFVEKNIVDAFKTEGYECTINKDGVIVAVSSQPTEKMIMKNDKKFIRQEAFSTWATT